MKSLRSPSAVSSSASEPRDASSARVMSPSASARSSNILRIRGQERERLRGHGIEPERRGELLQDVVVFFDEARLLYCSSSEPTLVDRRATICRTRRRSNGPSR